MWAGGHYHMLLYYTRMEGIFMFFSKAKPYCFTVANNITTSIDRPYKEYTINATSCNGSMIICTKSCRRHNFYYLLQKHMLKIE